MSVWAKIQIQNDLSVNKRYTLLQCGLQSLALVWTVEILTKPELNKEQRRRESAKGNFDMVGVWGIEKRCDILILLYIRGAVTV